MSVYIVERNGSSSTPRMLCIKIMSVTQRNLWAVRISLLTGDRHSLPIKLVT